MLLKKNELLSEDEIISPDFMVYEFANAIWKHEHLLKDLADGKPYLSVLWGLIDAGKITLVSPNERLTLLSYSMAKRNGITLYDAVFICLAIDLGMTLKTFDKVQAQVFESENKKKQLKKT
jgi:predicted nucleic acid-binding protein